MKYGRGVEKKTAKKTLLFGSNLWRTSRSSTERDIQKSKNFINLGPIISQVAKQFMSSSKTKSSTKDDRDRPEREDKWIESWWFWDTNWRLQVEYEATSRRYHYHGTPLDLKFIPNYTFAKTKKSLGVWKMTLNDRFKTKIILQRLKLNFRMPEGNHDVKGIMEQDGLSEAGKGGKL